MTTDPVTLSDIAASIEELKASSAKTDASVEQLKTSAAKTEVSVGQLQTSVGRLQVSSVKTDASIQQLQASAAKTNNSIEGLKSFAAKTDTTLADINASINDLGSSIADMSTMTMEAIIASESRLRAEFHLAINDAFEKLDKRISAIEVAQRETNQRLARIEGRQEALEADVKELYGMIADLRKEFKRFTDDERRRYRSLVRWARRVAIKTGIPFQA